MMSGFGKPGLPGKFAATIGAADYRGAVKASNDTCGGHTESFFDKWGLAGQVAVVFGASGLVGSASAAALAERGAKVVLHYHKGEEKAQELAKRIKAGGGEALLLRADAQSQTQVDTLYSRALKAFGRIDIAVATVHPSSPPKPVADMEWQDWSPHLAAIKCHFSICKGVLPVMRQQGHGRIIYISGGLARRYFAGCAAYSTVKAGLNAFCKTMALEVGKDNITVNIVAPGKVVSAPDSDGGHDPAEHDELGGSSSAQVPLRRFASADDVAGAVLYFAGRNAGGITGQTLYVAGGEVMP